MAAALVFGTSSALVALVLADRNTAVAVPVVVKCSQAETGCTDPGNIPALPCLLLIYTALGRHTLRAQLDKLKS